MGRNRIKSAVTGTTRTSIQVLLAEDVQSLGEQGDVVRVKPGYARNYLLPQGLATIATEHNKRMVERHIVRVEQARTDKIKAYRDLAASVSKYSVTLEANANKDGHLYGSVVSRDISEALKSSGYTVEPEHIMLEGPLKELGMYTVKVELHADVKTEVKVWVVPSAEA